MDEPILIVDDDVNLNHLLAKFLERNGFLATAAYSAEEALKTLSTRKFRIVLTDLRLPHKDGLCPLSQLCRRTAAVPGQQQGGRGTGRL